MASIKDVAKLSEVSVATVSRVLNDKGYVSEDTRKKVEQAIAELNYRPNEVARSLFKKQSKTIGLIVPDITNPYFPELAKAVEDTAMKLGYTMILCNSDEDIEKEQRYLDILLQKYVDGIIVFSNTLSMDQIRKLNIPIVSIDREISKDLPTIVVNNKKGAKLASSFLREKGCKRIAHLRGPYGIVNADERYAGYMDVVAEEEWFHEGYIVNGDYDMHSSIEATTELLRLHPEIDGIFAASDTMAIGAIKAVHKLGMKVPEDISIIGFNGIRLSEATTPELTTIVQPIYELGETALTMLVKLIEQQPMEEIFYKLDVHLVEREST
ncbi:LacI family DNA-binding transcriptional regulator [Metabacillus fastidiosus]|uniref:LacI family DNA-binding transcriptional regulator n=1 Tax=Metabacillus fastidiosus TaxID=1458 RepID=A0ABU6NYT5_9BACI|nr:LacI family DNA-binding transcriptional regulator [Metabacillus fastidiosus]MED4402196.1 LacI family DNA-binding transcriptional regulator [Metabacillus fastidiosus]MED4464825.1 LacI family DNA-binding transcriptional regulator [Metabacillus fastidiosus]